jgi:hypothetical protein
MLVTAELVTAGCSFGWLGIRLQGRFGFITAYCRGECYLRAETKAPSHTLLISGGVADLRTPNADSRVTFLQYGFLLPQRLKCARRNPSDRDTQIRLHCALALSKQACSLGWN